MSNRQIALAKFKNGYNCAQSVLYCYADKTGISADLALKMSNDLALAWVENKRCVAPFRVES